MAYCVHCGVKLADGEKRCPLCQTRVWDPASPPDASAQRAYPMRTPTQEIRRNKRLLLFLCGLLFLAPAALCLMIDLLAGNYLTWSIYPGGALLSFFVISVSVIYLLRRHVYITLCIHLLSLSAFLYLVEKVSGSGPWFFLIVLPSLILAHGFCALLVLFFRLKRLNKLTVIAAACAAVGLECLAIEYWCSKAIGQALSMQWSAYVAAPCIFICLTLFYINSNRTIREELRRRLHY